VLYGMLATMLLTALVWESLTATRQDQEILGVLPVRPRTVAAARFAAALGLALAFSLAINGPAAFVYSLASSVHPLVGSFPRVLLAHLTAATLGCAATFLALLTLRAIVTLVAGERTAARLAVVLQVVTFVLLVETFVFLPVVLPSLMQDLRAGGVSYGWWPPLWFTALFNLLAEGRLVPPELVARGVTAAAVTAAAAVALAVLPSRWMARRAIETLPTTHSAVLGRLARHVAGFWPIRTESRTLFLFAVASLTRSPRHALVLATYLGLAIATAIIETAAVTMRGTLAWDAPRGYVLAMPLIAMFFAVLGLRAACGIPVEDANWPMRLRPPTTGQARAATRLFILGLGVGPVVVVWALVCVLLWGWAMALRIGVADAVAGVILTEVALLSWTRIPFATVHEPAPDMRASRWLGLVVALYLFGFALANVQASVLLSVRGLAGYAMVAAVLLAVAAVQGRRVSRGAPVMLDAPSDDFDGLRLSPAMD
jgi:hypothetical protein